MSSQNGSGDLEDETKQARLLSCNLPRSKLGTYTSNKDQLKKKKTMKKKKQGCDLALRAALSMQALNLKPELSFVLMKG